MYLPVSQSTTADTHPGVFECYLYIWIAVCMGIGLLFSRTILALADTIGGWQIRGVSISIGICLFLMMYPALLNLQLDELKKFMRNPKPILLTIISNWIVAPIVTAILAYTFLRGHDQLIVALILLGSSSFTAMVLVWGSLAQGNQEQNFINTSLNTVTIMILYAPVVALLTGISDVQIDRVMLFASVLIFIGVPLILGYVSRQMLVRQKGADWFQNIYKPIVGKISMLALLTTLIILFALNGDVLISNPEEMILVSIPLLLGFLIVVGYNLLVTRLAGLKYKEAIITVLIGSSSHFEIAIATAVGLYGVGSKAALGTTIGLFWEVPVMLGLVSLGRRLHSKNFWRG